MSKGKTAKTIKEQRIPIVVILGHVDHGKTTILDKIRKSNVQSCEAGGITQKISVFTVDPKGDGKSSITFIDTPGHEAFDLMRARGGSIADIALLVVAADDGVKPQTKESIEIIKKSGVKPIVVINKCDLPGINLEKVKREIVNNGIELEGMGGKIPVIEVSGKTGKGIHELLELINLVADVEGLRVQKNLPAGIIGKAFVLESVRERSRGNVSTVILIQGSLCKGSWLGYKLDKKIYTERIKGIISEEGKNLCDLNAGCGGKILGLGNLLPLGIDIYMLKGKDENLLKEKIYDISESNEEVGNSDLKSEVDIPFFDKVADDNTKVLRLIIKSSSQGALEAIIKSINKIKEKNCRIEIFNSGVGNITVHDIEEASITKAIILGFEVKMETGAKDLLSKKKVVARTYDVIYKLVEEVEEVASSIGEEEINEEEIGNSVVKMIFTLSDGTKVLGNRVNDGIMKKDCKCYIVRGDNIITEGKIKSIRKGKNSVIEAKAGEDCGIVMNINVDEVKEGDKMYCNKVLH